MKCALRCIFENEPFLDGTVKCDAKWVTIADDSLSGFTIINRRSISQSQRCIRRKLWPVFGGLKLVLSTTTS
jgi:hypothetical protein